MAEAREILIGLKGKYPQIDIDATLATGTSTYSYLDNPVMMNLAIGGPDAGRSIVKSAFSLAVANGVAPSECDEAKRYLANGEDACFGYFNEVDLLEGRPKNTLLHCVAVGSTDDGLLLAYVELFSVFRMVVCLAAKYSGKPISAVYAIDPVTGTELDVTVRLRFCREDLADIYAYRRIPDGAMAQALDELIPDAMRRSFEREKAAVIDRALENAWRKLDLVPGTMLTPEHMAKLSALIVEEMQPFLLHNAPATQKCPSKGHSISAAGQAERFLDGIVGWIELTTLAADAQVHPETGRHYALNEKTAVLFVRPRGWHLPEKHVLVDGEPMSGALFDFGLFFFHNSEEDQPRFGHAAGAKSFGRRAKMRSYLRSCRYGAIACP